MHWTQAASLIEKEWCDLGRDASNETVTARLTEIMPNGYALRSVSPRAIIVKILGTDRNFAITRK